MLKTHSAVGVLLAASTSFAMAQTDTQQPELEQMVVWGTEVRASSVYMDSSDIAIRQADHISDLLRTIPGVDVGGAHSMNQRITIRSMDDKDLRISIDGANQNTYMYHHMGNLQIHADILKSVDIDVGTNSVINGGLGGAVRFETKEAKDLLAAGEHFGGRIEGTVSDNSSNSVSLSAYAQLGSKVDLLAYFNHVERDNYEVGGGEIKDSEGEVIPGTDGTVRGLEGELNDALIKIGVDLTSSQRLEFGYETYSDEGDYSYRPDMGLATDLAITNSLNVPLLWPTEFTRDTYTLNYDASIGSRTTLKAALFRNESTLWRDEMGWADNPAYEAWAAIVEGEAQNTGFNLLGETVLGESVINTLTYGVDVTQYKTNYTATYVGGAVDEAGEEATESAVFLQDRIELGMFAIIPGVRYNEYDIESAIVTKTYDDVTTALAAEFQPTDSLQFRVSSTELFKGPDISEVFVGAGLFEDPNPELDAESGRNDEIAVAYGDAILGADQFSVGATLFRTNIEGYIYQYASPVMDNVGDMEVTGGEAYIGYDLGGLRTLLTYSDAESELDAYAGYEEFQGARIDRQQGDTWSLNLDYEFANIDLQLHYDLLMVGDVSAGPDLDGPTLENSKDGYTVHNVSLQWAPTDGLQITAGVDNLFDEFYASQSSRTGVSFHPRFGELYLFDYEPGRNLKATVSYQF
ncbi:TonB-dependent receptor [Gilvimarinus sp. SDUM040013]|uniref:TonB-dependent receptor n=1 Tax=Gilvimarinus gilvus TaxID=3058038 RepID=A0ABU4S2K9_9GAMM|nr:TonB-dependent receptor [Gilvimarinus sp. SDUM040013]MDO3384581.1 TonB-dependent receptor [Gilvimarinus sp. SDUM040013]MDX6850083.1 TonB-dependent receptor [Gilvimarinus sp. SDUM040013]